MSKQEIVNGKIVSSSLGPQRGIFTCTITIEGDGWGQSFGQYALDTYDEDKKERVGTAYGLEFIKRILEVFEVRRWEDLVGTHIRILRDWNNIYKVGHIIKDQWFDPKDLALEFEGE